MKKSIIYFVSFNANNPSLAAIASGRAVISTTMPFDVVSLIDSKLDMTYATRYVDILTVFLNSSISQDESLFFIAKTFLNHLNEKYMY